jgi:ribose-phosphate pyrophosphokinase
MYKGDVLMKILSGTSNLSLSRNIARQLKLKLVNTNIKSFADGEIYVEINENIRGNSVFVIQSTSTPANDNLMELLLCIDALRRSSAKNITAVIPYFGYARQDRKVVPRTSISAKLVSNLITNAGASRIVTVDLHSGQIQGFFDIPVDNLFTTPLFARYIKKNLKNKNLICVSPDVGGVQRTRGLATKINIDLAIIDKRRPQPGKSQVMRIIGNVQNKECIIVDDIIDSGGTIVNAVDALIKEGAKSVYVFVTHAVLSGEAINKIKKSKINKLIITDSIDNTKKIKSVNKIQVLSIAPLMAEAIKRISNSTSVSSLFN